MIPRVVTVVLLLALCACKSADESHTKAFLGAVLIDGAGGPPLSNSVVVVAGEYIRDAGARSTVVIPSEADKIDGSSRFLVPAPVDLWPRTFDGAVYVVNATPEAAAAAVESARGRNLPAFVEISTQAAVRQLVTAGASGFLGMMVDTEDLDSELVARLRNLRIPFAPSLVNAGSSLEVAKRNTKRLFQAGVPIAVGTHGGDVQREMELLADAGIPPLDVIVAATHNGAVALHLADRGGIAPGRRADLLLLSANPGEEIRNFRQVALRMAGGEWVK